VIAQVKSNEGDTRPLETASDTLIELAASVARTRRQRLPLGSHPGPFRIKALDF
jgi:hypothetical protein